MPRKSWWARLPFGVRMTAGASAVLMVVGGGTAGIATITKDEPRIVTAVRQDTAVLAEPASAQPAVPPAVPGTTPPTAAAATLPPAAAGLGAHDAAVEPDRRTEAQADRTATRTPRKEAVAGRPAPAATRAPAAKPAAPAPPPPVVTNRTEVERRTIPYRTRLVRDPGMERGQKRVQNEGVPGEQELRYLVRVEDGQPVERRLVGSTVVREPQHRVVAFGTKRSGCRDDRCHDGPGNDGPDDDGPGDDGPGWRSAGCEQTTDETLLSAEDLRGLELDAEPRCPTA